MAHQHRVIGVLARDAQVRICAGGAYVLDIEMTQRREEAPIVARRQYGHGASAAIAAHSAANCLRRGTTVEAWCAGIGIGYTADDTSAIALRGVDQITAMPCIQQPPPICAEEPASTTTHHGVQT